MKKLIIIILIILVFFVLCNGLSNLKIDENKLTKFVNSYCSLFETKIHAIIALLIFILIIIVGSIYLIKKENKGK